MIELYAKDTKSKLRVWKIFPAAFGYTMMSGLYSGKQISKFVSVTEGKANRTIEQQIDLEMASRAKRKRDSGFVDNADEAERQDRTNGLGFELPMLAKPKVNDYDKVNSQVQIKYNGLRCLIKNIGGIKYAYSKSGILYPAVKHIQDTVDIPEGTTIDGELYHHGTALQTINSWVKKSQPNTELLEYQCYDLISGNPFHERLDELRSYNLGPSAHVVPTWGIQSINIVEKMAEVRADGYEGLIIRQPGYGYQSGQRNTAMLKIKQFLDAEFQVLNMSLSREGFTMLHCQSQSGVAFKVTAPGSHARKVEIYENSEQYIHKFITVEYAELSNKGVPMQAVAKYFRDFE